MGIRLPEAFEDTFFISGLPRSGSTLLGSILRQNPAISAGMTSPMYSLVNGLLSRLSNANEFNAFISDAARRRLLGACSTTSTKTSAAR